MAMASQTTWIDCQATAKAGEATLKYQVRGYAIQSHGMPSLPFQYSNFSLSLTRVENGKETQLLTNSPMELLQEEGGIAMFSTPAAQFGITVLVDGGRESLQITHEIFRSDFDSKWVFSNQGKCLLTEEG